MRSLSLFILFVVYTMVTHAQLKNKHLLIFTKNGKGYIHENIPSSIAALQKLGIENGFTTDTTTNSALFTDENLKNMMRSFFQIPTMMYLITMNKMSPL